VPIENEVMLDDLDEWAAFAVDHVLAGELFRNFHHRH
jgi:hypothetical protein